MTKERERNIVGVYLGACIIVAFAAGVTIASTVFFAGLIPVALVIALGRR